MNYMCNGGGATGAVGACVLAETGGASDLVTTIFYILTAVVLMGTGITLMRLSTTRKAKMSE